MRSLVAVLLVGLIAACPLVCEAAGSDQSLHQCQPDTTCDEPGAPDPAPCSDDGGNCICSGAIQGVGVRVSDHDPTPLPTPTLFALPAPGLRQPLSPYLARDGAAAGPGRFGDSGTVRALIQVYRC
ncbi:hypothetical protein [Tautonia sociabilis]|uniref:Uncharacterized protein n=1 Tax=Tautonia sociabilis TaxID=2080755 RepID=A0A432MI16_9BACT|nr:hypothetical protein [Tautonia sociabilis]RUL87011.1 hypothetical protein TsocGM_14535 [Tautonia sociabilis]